MRNNIKVEDLFGFNLLSILENDLKNGESFTVEFSDGEIIEFKDLATFKDFLKERKIK